MTEDRFIELVNLYLDREIEAPDLRLLEAELSRNPERRRSFEERCRLYVAMQNLFGESADEADVSVTAHSKPQKKSRGSVVLHLKRTIRHAPAVGLGLAACVALGFVLFVPVISTSSTAASFEEVSTAEPDTIPRVRDIRRVGRSDLKRFANRRQVIPRRTTSLAAELRLVGLSPKLIEEEAPTLKGVEVVDFREAEIQRRVQLLSEIEGFSPLPEPSLLNLTPPVDHHVRSHLEVQRADLSLNHSSNLSRASLVSFR